MIQNSLVCLRFTDARIWMEGCELNDFVSQLDKNR